MTAVITTTEIPPKDLRAGMDLRARRSTSAALGLS
jgi:hypothetical protein